MSGEEVKILRTLFKLTQKQLSLRLGVSRSHLANLEAGRRRMTPKIRKKWIKFASNFIESGEGWKRK